jgi:hypothetical protein
MPIGSARRDLSTLEWRCLWFMEFMWAAEALTVAVGAAAVGELAVQVDAFAAARREWAQVLRIDAVRLALRQLAFLAAAEDAEETERARHFLGRGPTAVQEAALARLLAAGCWHDAPALAGMLVPAAGAVVEDVEAPRELAEVGAEAATARGRADRIVCACGAWRVCGLGRRRTGGVWVSGSCDGGGGARGARIVNKRRAGSEPRSWFGVFSPG